MTAFTNAFPRKSSRTSTHAVIVPSTALSATTSSDMPSVSSSAAIPSGLVTASQNPPAPFFVDAQVSAAIGRITKIERNVVMKPSDRAVPALSPPATR